MIWLIKLKIHRFIWSFRTYRFLHLFLGLVWDGVPVKHAYEIAMAGERKP